MQGKLAIAKQLTEGIKFHDNIMFYLYFPRKSHHFSNFKPVKRLEFEERGTGAVELWQDFGTGR